MRSDFEEHVVPAGARCWFRERDHSYWRGIEPKRKDTPEGDWKGVGRLTGVSTAAQPFDFRPDNLMRWAAKTNGIGVAALYNRSLKGHLDGDGQVMTLETRLGWLEDADTIWRELERESLTFNDVRDQAAERGTNVHKHALYALATGKPVPDYHELTDDEQGYAQGIASFWLDHDPEPLHAELVVIDLDLGVAGHLDVLCRLRARCGRSWCPCNGIFDPRAIVLLDAKTSGYIPLKHHVQLAGYGHCATVSGHLPPLAELILQVDENGGYQLIPACATVEDFKVAVDAYRRAAAIDSAAKANRKEREKAV